MNKTEINNLLTEKHNEIFDFLNAQAEEKWEQGPEGKWTTGQHVLHLLQCIKPLNKAMNLPKFVLRYRFGKSNRAVRDYKTVCEKYKTKVVKVKNVVSPFSQNLATPTLDSKATLIAKLNRENLQLQQRLLKWNDKKLDVLVLPHPLMGKMPVREIVMWTAFHTQMHCEILKEKYT